MGNWGISRGRAGQSASGDSRAKELMVRCPFCSSEFRVWILPGDVFIDCQDYSCGKTFILEELLRSEYRAKNGEIKDD